MTKQKIQMAFYLPVYVKELIRDVYIKRMKEDKKTSQGDIVSEAITYWYKARHGSEDNLNNQG